MKPEQMEEFEAALRPASSAFLRRWYLIFLVLLTFLTVITFILLISTRYVVSDIALIQDQLSNWEVIEE